MLHKKTLIALAAAVALGCVPVATNALAAGHPNSGHGGGGQAFAGHSGGGHAFAGRGGGGRAMAGPARGGNGGWLRPRWTDRRLRRGGRVVVRSGGGGTTTAVAEVYDWPDLRQLFRLWLRVDAPAMVFPLLAP